MYNLLVADDERNYVESVANQIRRNFPDFNVITARDGADALAVILATRIHAMILDIKMPHMTGLELLDEMKNREINDILTIISSGHDEFEYARNSLKLGVLDYILKPVDPETLEEICLKLKQRLDAKDRKDRELTNLRKQVEESKPIIKERFFNDLVHREMDVSRFNDTAQFLELNIGRFFRVAIIEVVAEVHGASGNQQREMETTIRIAENYLVKHCRGNPHANLFHPNSDHFVLLYAFDVLESPVACDVDQSLNDLKDAMLEELGISATIGIGKSVEGFRMIARSYAQGSDALNYKYIHGTGHVYNIQDFERTTARPVTQTPEEIVSLIKTEQTSQLLAGIRSMFSNWESLSGDDVLLARLHAYNYLLAILTVAEECGLAYGKLTGSTYELPRTSSVVEIERFITEAVIVTINELGNLRKDKNRHIIDAIRKYIAENYQNDISNAILADELGYSANYIGQIFIATTGKTINEYLKLTRINAAKKLLKNTGYKIVDIASQVGFSDQQYFGMVFKKHVGVTPTEYRNV